MSGESPRAPSCTAAGGSEPPREAASEAGTFTHAVIGVFDTHAQAEQLVKVLAADGFPLRQLSIVVKGYHSEEQPIGFYTTADRVKAWGGAGALWGALFGLLLGAAFFWFPDISAVAAVGPITYLLIAAVEGAAVIGVICAIGAALASIGLSKNGVIKYESQVKADSVVVIARSSSPEVARARTTMERESAKQTTIVEA